MGDMSIWHIIVFLILILLLVFAYFLPIAKILRKAGYSGWWCLIALIPFGAIIGLWVFAASDWPALGRQG